MQKQHRHAVPTTARAATSNAAAWRDVRDDHARSRNCIRRSPPPSLRTSMVQPRRAVEREPLTLLSDDTMAALYVEQLHKELEVTKPEQSTHPSHTTDNTTHKHGYASHAEPQYEPRTSDGKSRPRTSTSTSTSSFSTSSSSSSCAPQPPNADDATAIARVLNHSIVLESAAMTRASPSAPSPPPPQQQRDCQVCYERIDASDIHSCSTCRGAFCKSCVRWYMEYKILEGEVSDKKLVCPAPQCMRALPQDYIQQHVAPATYAKYLAYRENQRPGVRFCPRPGCCMKIQEPLHTTTRRACCAACGHESCMKCGEAFHVVATCRRREKRYGKWRTRSNVHKCPSCKTDIEKQGGCAHMRCFQCDTEFCWSCLRAWETHDETLCVPLSFLRSKSPKFGTCKPVRAVTKSVAVGAAVVVGAAGLGVGLVVLPPLLLVHWLRRSSRFHRQRESLHSDAFIVE